jgi:Family of unknown function (DUF5522)
MTQPQSPDPSPPPLREGEDYYIERGRWVFTEAYHLKRGYCCDSGCRHCPYKKSKRQVPEKNAKPT